VIEQMDRLDEIVQAAADEYRENLGRLARLGSNIRPVAGQFI
jgi:hypothetical protein